MSRSRKAGARSTYHHGNLRQALVEEALRMLSESSPEAFTLREAARRVGVDHRAAYRHFEDKEALLAAVAFEGYRALTSAMQAALAVHPPADHVERLRAIARACVVFAAKNRAYYQVITGPRLNQTGRFPELEPVIAEAFAVLRDEITAGVKAGQLRAADELDCAIALWAMTHGIANLVVSRRVRVSDEKLSGYVDRLVNHALLGIAAH